MSVIGENLNPGLNAQIKKRQEKLGRQNLDVNDIIYQNSNNSWLRVASSVNVADTFLAQVSDFQLEGNGLAKNLVLFGPSVNDKGEFGNKALSDPNDTLANQVLANYGVAGNTSKWGYTPPPAVESLSIQALNRGAIRKASLSIVAHNPDQFRLIETLYLRLGFTILVEWGHGVYYDNEGNLERRNAFSTKPFTAFMGGGQEGNFTRINSLIEEEIEHSNYNYDGFLGYISNFNWSFQSDGTYQIQLDVISRGGLIDSLRTNHPATEDATNKVSKEVFEDPKNPKGEIITQVFQTVKDATKGEYAGDFMDTNGDWWWSGSPGVEGQVQSENGMIWVKIEDYFGFPISKGSEIVRFDMKTNGAPHLREEVPQYYVTMGFFLRLLQDRCLYYNGTEPILGISHFYQRSAMLTHPYQQSIDPKVCLLGKSSSPAITDGKNSAGKNSYPRGAEFDDLFRTDNRFKGDIMGILLNLDFILETITATKDEEGRVALGDLVTNILDGVMDATGNLNSLKISYAEKTNRLQIFDDMSIPGVTPEGETAKIYIYGVDTKNNEGSFVKDVSFSSKIFPNLQNSVAIAAQNPDATAGEQISSFQRLNKGLVDRIASGTKPYKQPTSKSPYQLFTKEIYNVSNHLSQCWNLGTLHEQSRIDEASTPLQSILNYDLQWRAGLGEITSPFFIPVELSLTMHGIAGFDLYTKFDIGPDYILPPSYPSNVNFIVQGVSHDIKDNEWTTTVNTLSWPSSKGEPVTDLGGIIKGEPDSQAARDLRKKPIPNNPNPGAPIATDPSRPAELWWGDIYSLQRSFGVKVFSPTTPETVVQYVNPKARPYFLEFLQLALKEPLMQGLKISINSAVRTFEDQAGAANAHADVAAVPGKSPHNYGMALDITLYDLQTGVRLRNNDNTPQEWVQTGIVDALNTSRLSSWGATYNRYDPLHFGMKFSLSTGQELAKNLAISKGKQLTELTAAEILSLDIPIYPGINNWSQNNA